MFGQLEQGSACRSIPSGRTCDTVTSGDNPCIADGSISFHCPTQNILRDTKPYLVSPNILCRVCGVPSTVADSNPEGGEFRGRISWGPNMRDGQINETFITGYKVTVVDRCGLPLEVPGGDSFRYLPKLQTGSPSCCSEQTYSLVWSLILPAGYAYFMIVPYSDVWGEQDAGMLIRIDDAGGSAPRTTNLRSITSRTVRRWSRSSGALAAGVALLCLAAGRASPLSVRGLE